MTYEKFQKEFRQQFTYEVRQQFTYEEFQKEFKHQFYPEFAEDKVQANLQRLSQRGNVHEYAQKFLELLLEILDMSENDLSSLFLMGTSHEPKYSCNGEVSNSSPK